MALTAEEKKGLLKLAREVIESDLTGGKAEFRVGGLPSEGRGAFVTLHEKGRLRGCIGTFSNEEPLYKTVMDMAVAAASQDPRFEPVRADELAAIEIEISALTPPRAVAGVNEIEVGRHGIYFIMGRNRGVLLPQVAVEQGYTREEFLDATCVKAGVAPGSWRKGGQILIFEAEIFREGAASS